MQQNPVTSERPAQSFQIPGGVGEATLFVWRQCPPGVSPGTAPAVVYVCGATFASQQAVGFRFDGRSWADELAGAGYEVWGFDFAGYGRSGRYSEMDGPPAVGPPLGRAPVAAVQLERVVRFICDQRCGGRVSLLAHSWGTMPAAILASDSPECIERLLFFAPITQRADSARTDGGSVGAWYPLSVEAQRQRFVQDVPAGHAAVMHDRDFSRWASGYLDSEPQPTATGMPTVRTPAGPAVDILAAWGGKLPYDPSRIHLPLCVIRGEWDSLCTDADARWLWDALVRSPLKREVKLSKATHLMHLQEGRHALYRETLAFLGDPHSPPVGVP